MAHSTLFISNSTGDDDFVRELQTQLAVHGVDAWIDSRQLRGGDGLWTGIAVANTPSGSDCPYAVRNCWHGLQCC